VRTATLRFALLFAAAGMIAGGASLAHAQNVATEGAPAAAPAGEPGPDEKATWDQAASIRGAAERLGRLHRAKGATAAYQLIDNCYKTHSLASNYGEGFETCIAQDYLETRTLIQVYSRMPPEALRQSGVPSPAELADSMGKRISLAFTKYGKSQAYADEVKKLVDEHGLPVFLAIVFPEATRAMEDKKAKEKSERK
jgi:hypothetical protein